MATNDFKVFDENNQNVLSDEEYAMHDQRLNGVVAGMADSKMHNKLFKQTSTMAAAIGEALKDKGLDAPDTDKAQLKENIKAAFGGDKVYHSFADIDPTYTNDTLFATVYNAMAANSILRTPVNANATDYPADGLLEVIKQDANHGACTLSAADGVYNLSITPENIEQIFGGGGGVK